MGSWQKTIRPESYEQSAQKPLVWAAYVVVAYDGPYGKAGEIISKHKTYAAAERAAKGNTWLAITAAY